MNIMDAMNELKTVEVGGGLKTVETMNVGDVFRQGDIYIVKVEDSHKKGDETGITKLAEGSSKGSSHIAVGNVRVFKGSLPSDYDYSLDDLVGPCIVATDRFAIEHPEHDDVSLPAGTYQIMYQLDTRTMSKVID